MSRFGWYPVFLKEMLLFRRKLLKLGYLFSAMVIPIIYLLAFGFCLGGRVQITGMNYLSYLVYGLVAMSSMNNSYTWVCSFVLYHGGRGPGRRGERAFRGFAHYRRRICFLP